MHGVSHNYSNTVHHCQLLLIYSPGAIRNVELLLLYLIKHAKPNTLRIYMSSSADYYQCMNRHTFNIDSTVAIAGNSRQ